MRFVVGKATFLAVVAVTFVLATTTTAKASELDLTTGGGCTGTACDPSQDTGSLTYFAGALWSTTTIQPTGTGYIDSFLRIHDSSATSGLVTDGMNTDGTLKNDELSGGQGGKNYTRSVLLSDLQTQTVDGQDYYAFLLDINQEGGDPLLNLSGLQFCTGTSGSLSFADTCAGTGSTLRYDMQFDTGAPPASCLDNSSGTQPNCVYSGTDLSQTPTNTVLLDYGLNHGSGSGDMVVYIPKSVLPTDQGDYLYLWSQFGAPIACGDANCPTNNDGYEEWAFLGGTNEGGFQPPPSVPEPGSLVLLGTGLLLGGRLIRRRSQKQQASKAE